MVCNEGTRGHGADTGPAAQRAALPASTHTRGPWRKQPKYAERGKFAGHVAVYAENGGPIAYLPKGPHDHINEANAALIAAAPDLLAALEFVASDPCFVKLGSVTHDEVRAAIAKARNPS